MGLVYRARQLKAQRLVALKMIRAIEHATPQQRLRFQIETEAVARLQHPNIVQLYEVGEVRGQPYFSLEFCGGGTLTEQLKKKPPSPREAAELIETLARAMHYAHLRGVVHRDLKPGNVLLASPVASAPGGTFKITDFGLAKRIDAEARDVSQSGAIMGTASYMAPEQAAGKVRDTGPAADVYGLGALLYECLTGRPPFEGPQHVILINVQCDEPVPPSRVARSGDRAITVKVPRDLETICLKCLHKEPARRYASAEALADDLHRFLANEPILARPVGRVERAIKWARRQPALAALVGEICTRRYLDKPANRLSSAQANFNGNFYPPDLEEKIPKGPFLQRPSRVGAYPANKLGLCDMHGNVWQWCADQTPPMGSGRLSRGGAWHEIGYNCRASSRFRSAPWYQLISIGFRLARVPFR
jgi:serine/threonine-protein kinase